MAWHKRFVTAQDRARFKNLMLLHQIILSAIRTSGYNDVHELKKARKPNPERQSAYSFLFDTEPSGFESCSLISNMPIEWHLKEATCQETLENLENIVLGTLASALHILELSPKLLDLAAEFGKKSGLEFESTNASTSWFRDCLHFVPFSHDFVSRRITPFEIDLNWTNCPCQSRIPEVVLGAPELCSFFCHWLKGFGQIILPSFDFHHSPGSSRSFCKIRWINARVWQSIDFTRDSASVNS